MSDVYLAVVRFSFGEVVTCYEDLVTWHLTDVTDTITLNAKYLRWDSNIQRAVRGSKEGRASAST